MAELSDVQILNAAADRLEALCAAATDGPWFFDGPYWHTANDGESEETSLVATRPRPLGGRVYGRNPVLLGVPTWARNAPIKRADANVRYAAAMDPDVGRALVSLLRYAALEAAEIGACGQAVDLARTILKGTPS